MKVNVARIEWFKHGKWPKWLVGLHYYTIASFILLAITGVALYLPLVHTALIRYLPVIYDVHILLGLVFMVTLVTPFLKWLPKGRRIWRFDWVMPTIFGAPLVVTGLMLWGVTLFPTAARARAFTWHGVLTAVFGGWILIHAFYKALGLRPSSTGLAGRVDPDRRMFLKSLGTGVLGSLLVTFLDPLALFRNNGISSATSNGTTATGVQRFPAYYTVVNGFPKMTVDNYQLHIGGSVQTPKTLAWSDVQNFPKYSEIEDFHCVTGWSVANVHWAGIHISQLVEHVKPAKSVQYVHFFSFDGQYSESLKLSEALDPSVVLAYEMDGKPLLQSQGFPLRLVVPKMYGYKSIKWVNKVEFSDKPLRGFWEQRGYPTEAYFKHV